MSPWLLTSPVTIEAGAEFSALDSSLRLTPKSQMLRPLSPERLHHNPVKDCGLTAQNAFNPVRSEFAFEVDAQFYRLITIQQLRQ